MTTIIDSENYLYSNTLVLSSIKLDKSMNTEMIGIFLNNRFPLLRTLNCTNTPITTIPLLPNLEELICSKCDRLVEIPELCNLKILDCYQCTELIEIPKLPHLTYLDCTGCNKLTRIPELHNLKELRCTKCEGITTLPILPT
jgi:Leucine-rich repeat (LRR) protein